MRWLRDLVCFSVACLVGTGSLVQGVLHPRALAKPGWQINGRFERKRVILHKNVPGVYQDCFRGIGFVNCEVQPDTKGVGEGLYVVPNLDNNPFHWRSTVPKGDNYCVQCCSNTHKDPWPEIEETWAFSCPLDGMDKRDAEPAMRDSDLESSVLFEYEFRFATRKTFAPNIAQVQESDVDNLVTRCDMGTYERGRTLYGYHLTINVKMRQDDDGQFWRSVTGCNVEPVFGPEWCEIPGKECDRRKCVTAVAAKDRDAVLKHCIWFNETITLVSDGVDNPYLIGTWATLALFCVGMVLLFMAYRGGWIHCNDKGPGPD